MPAYCQSLEHVRVCGYAWSRMKINHTLLMEMTMFSNTCEGLSLHSCVLGAFFASKCG